MGFIANDAFPDINHTNEQQSTKLGNFQQRKSAVNQKVTHGELLSKVVLFVFPKSLNKVKTFQPLGLFSLTGHTYINK